MPWFHVVPRKPWPFRNEYHSVCCCTSGIMWGIEMVEGKDHPQQLGQPQHDNLGSTIGLLLQILTPIFFKGFIVILDSGFCVLKHIVEVRKRESLPVHSSKRDGTGHDSFMEMRSRTISATNKLEIQTHGLGGWMTSPFMYMP